MASHTTETPVLDLIGTMTAESIAATDLDARTLMMVRFAALVGVDAPPASYLMNLAAAKDVGVDEKTARDILIAIAPIVGTPHVVSALGKIARALGLAIDLAELDEETTRD
ncbi:MAG TPA: carboxymuconolactone decarboxylase [Candidatus Dormibacteraeota bacterium]|nr:carboxymuconolactone decarboxylase [Candidatus Dormibacteraeota bacterium]